MLVLTRKPGEVVFIDNEIRIEVLEMKSGRVSLGITAPGTIEVDRSEISDTVDPASPPDDSSSTSSSD